LAFHDSRMLTLGPNFTQVDTLLNWIDLLSEETVESELLKSQNALQSGYGIDVNLDSVDLIANEILREIDDYSHNKKISRFIGIDFKLYLKIFIISFKQFIGQHIKKLVFLNSKNVKRGNKANQLTNSLIKSIATELGIIDEISRFQVEISRNKKSLVLKKLSGP
jgi:hypothetical protein